jgi:4-hydroxybenzoate polyprenyltransferase
MRVLLVLGRVSNLPTVWSNCLAAWLLAGGGIWQRFGLVCLGATLLYTGGMFLNDAVDAGFDRRYRPERPIPSGQISPRIVWVLAMVWLAGGWAVFFALGKLPTQFASALLLAIVVYDLVHKHTALSPVLMAACRFLLYLLAASSVGASATRDVLWHATALAAYIIGLSYLARGESTGKRVAPWTVILLFVPIIVAFADPVAGATSSTTLAAVVLAAWIVWCLSMNRQNDVGKGPPLPSPLLPPARPEPLRRGEGPRRRGRRPYANRCATNDLPRPARNERGEGWGEGLFVGSWSQCMRKTKGVAGLLAGIVLVDWLATGGNSYPAAFPGLFVLALFLQRVAPAT